MVLTHISSCLLHDPSLLDYGIRSKIWCYLIYQVVYLMTLQCSTIVYALRYGANSYTKLFDSIISMEKIQS